MMKIPKEINFFLFKPNSVAIDRIYQEKYSLILSCITTSSPAKIKYFILHRSISIYAMITYVSEKDIHYLNGKV